jgi:hypothetical protein
MHNRLEKTSDPASVRYGAAAHPPGQVAQRFCSSYTNLQEAEVCLCKLLNPQRQAYQQGHADAQVICEDLAD